MAPTRRQLSGRWCTARRARSAKVARDAWTAPRVTSRSASGASAWPQRLGALRRLPLWSREREAVGALSSDRAVRSSGADARAPTRRCPVWLKQGAHDDATHLRSPARSRSACRVARRVLRPARVHLERARGAWPASSNAVRRDASASLATVHHCGGNSWRSDLTRSDTHAVRCRASRSRARTASEVAAFRLTRSDISHRRRTLKSALAPSDARARRVVRIVACCLTRSDNPDAEKR